jgi:N-acyl amino acid synthase of PEP-CTERM/exosortase system
MFDDHFEVFLGDTPRGRQVNYRVRYEVYCRETGFEDARVFPDGEERDHYDRHSVHFLVRHRASEAWVAAMRLVVPEGDGLPFEHACGIPATALPVPSRDAAEVSRLCMVERFRRRGLERFLPYEAVDRATDGSVVVPYERRTGPELLVGLLRAAYGYNRTLGFRHWYFLVAPALARIIRRTGVGLQPVAPACEHRGLRTPYVSDVEQSRAAILGSGSAAAGFFSREPAYRLFSELGEVEDDGLPHRLGLPETRGQAAGWA